MTDSAAALSPCMTWRERDPGMSHGTRGRRGGSTVLIPHGSSSESVLASRRRVAWTPLPIPTPESLWTRVAEFSIRNWKLRFLLITESLVCSFLYYYFINLKCLGLFNQMKWNIIHIFVFIESIVLDVWLV